jgi:hypothetical protein
MPQSEGPEPDQLEPGEIVLALAKCDWFGTIEKQHKVEKRIAVTDRRFLALKTGIWRGRSKGEVELEIPLRDVVAVHTEKRHPVTTYGVSVLAVTLVRSDGHGLAFGTGILGIKTMRKFVDALETAARNVPGTMYGSDIEATD